MKILQYVFSFFLLLIVVGCSNDPEEVINDFKKELDEVNEISQIKSAFESKGFKSVEEAAAYANSLIQDINLSPELSMKTIMLRGYPLK